MIWFGLAPENVSKVFVGGSSKDPVEFTSYALVGLNNFYTNY